MDNLFGAASLVLSKASEQATPTPGRNIAGGEKVTSSEASATPTDDAADAESTATTMQASSDDFETVILHSDSTLE